MHFGHNEGPLTQNVAVGDTLGCRNAAFAFVFHVDGCRQSSFVDITLKGGPGFGLFQGYPSKNRFEPANSGGNR
jgi:hypothetical protein